LHAEKANILVDIHLNTENIPVDSHKDKIVGSSQDNHLDNFKNKAVDIGAREIIKAVWYWLS
jgi:hypothetical protein